MTIISALAAPGTLTGLEMLAATSAASNARIPLSHLGGVARGTIAMSLAPYLADTASTVDADPGAGNVRWNHATQTSATEVYIDDSDSGAIDRSGAWATLASGGFLYLYNPANLDVWQKWQVTSVSDETGYLKLGVALQGSNGSFANDAPILLTLQQPEPSPGIDRNVVTAIASSSGVVTVNCALGDYFVLALTENVTSWVFQNVPPGVSLMLRIVQDSTPRAVTWPASFNWVGGNAGVVSTASAARDRLAITTDDTGTNWDATLGKAFS